MSSKSRFPRPLPAALFGALLCALPAAAADLTVSAAAATVGAFGLEVTVGSDCTSPDTISLTSPPQIEGNFEACSLLEASAVEVAGTGALFRAGTTIALGEGFRVAAGANFTAVIDPALADEFMSVDDPSPISETAYFATFYLRLDDLALAGGDAIEHFAAYSSSGETQFILTVRKNPGDVDSLHLAARENGGGLTQMIPGQELPLAAGWNKIDLEWTAGNGDGTLLVGVNDAAPSGLTGLTNTAALIETVRWGAVGGSITSTTGKMQLDGFDSWR